MHDVADAGAVNVRLARNVTVAIDPRRGRVRAIGNLNVFQRAIYVHEALGVLVREVNADDHTGAVDVIKVGTAADALRIVEGFVSSILQDISVAMAGGPQVAGRVRADDYTAVADAGRSC